MLEFQIRRDDYAAHRRIEAPTPTPREGEILARVERFSFTANNITYAVAGDQIGYWRFFPPHQADHEVWGVIPVWGFATIERSHVAGLAEGERVFGYFPPATHLLMRPDDIAPARFFDRAPHRAGLPDGYNLYRRVAAEPGYDPAHDDLRALLWPLHITSWCIADALSLADCHGATQMIILSASSKTSIGLAYAAKAASRTFCAIAPGLALAFLTQLLQHSCTSVPSRESRRRRSTAPADPADGFPSLPPIPPAAGSFRFIARRITKNAIISAQ